MSHYKRAEDRWAAVIERDSAADGHFFYAVSSTGIFCYPSCPSRLAKRENVTFYESSSQALSDGYQPCKRCRSNLPPLADRQRDTVIEACRLLADEWADGRIEKVAASLNISRFHLQKLFKKFLGLSPKAYSQAVRSQALGVTIQNASTATQALYEAGYDSPSNFYKDVASRLGMSVKELRRGASKVEIHYGFASTGYGKIVVASTANGICAVLFGQSKRELEADLKERFPKAILHPMSPENSSLLERVVQQIDHPDASSDIPLDIKGTVFQEKVWATLRQTSRGDTLSYATLASAVGQPKAARAVASACAANPVAVLVPCHRVVRADGSLSGYRWGVARKSQLLADEKNSKIDTDA